MIAITAACLGCGGCLLSCPQRAIRPAVAARGAGPLIVLRDRCNACGECVEVCPADAIEFLPDPVIAVECTHTPRKTHRDHECRAPVRSSPRAGRGPAPRRRPSNG